jgi:hypothetical protein
MIFARWDQARGLLLDGSGSVGRRSSLTKTTHQLLAEYRLNAVAHGAATNTGNSEVANKHHDALMEALHALREQGDQGAGALLGLLDDREAWVRCWAATHCLVEDEARAKCVLEKLVEEPGFVGFDAEMVLSLWEKGELTGV